MGDDPDDPTPIHWKDIEGRQGPFALLHNKSRRETFNRGVTSWIGAHDFKLVTATVDLKGHHERYGTAAWHPYHYAIRVIMERVCTVLRGWSRPSVIVEAESRNIDYDEEMNAAYLRVRETGTQFVDGPTMQSVFAGDDVHFFTKWDDVAGLQMADIVAVHAKSSTLIDAGVKSKERNGLRRRIAAKLEPHYHAGPRGTVLGHGRKLLSPGSTKVNGAEKPKPTPPRPTAVETAIWE